MSVFIGPRATTAELRAIVPVAGELVYDTNRNVYVYGDGSTQGGIPLSGGRGTRLPPQPHNNALVLFNRNGELQEGPAPGVSGTFLRAPKTRLEAPEYGPLTLADLPQSNTPNAVIVNDHAGGRNSFVARQLTLTDIDATPYMGYVKSDGRSFSTIHPDISLFVKIKSHEILSTNPIASYQIGMSESRQTLLTTAYSAYRIIGTNLKASADDSAIVINFYSKESADTQEQWFETLPQQHSSGQQRLQNTAYFHMSLTEQAPRGRPSEITLPQGDTPKLLGNAPADSCDFMMDLYHPYDQNSRKPYFISYLGGNEIGGGQSPSVTVNYGQIAGFFLRTQPITDIKISLKPGNILSGKISLYGLNI